MRVVKKWTKQEEEYLKTNYGDMTCREIGEHLGRSVSSVRKHLPCLGLNHSRNKYRFNDTYFDEINTPEKAYWFGFIAADGCIIDDSNEYKSEQHKRLKIALRWSDNKHLIKFRDCIQGNQPIKKKRSINKNWNIDTEECEIIIYSARIVNALEDKGLYPRKTYSLPFPTNEIISKDLMPHYIRGFIDADGSFTSRVRKESDRRVAEFSVVGATKKFLEDMREFLNSELGVNIGIYEKRKGNWRIIESSRENVLRILNYAYGNESLTYNSYLDRKYEKYQRIRQEIAVCIGDDADNKPGRNWKPKLNMSMVIRVEGSREPHAEHSK